MVKLKSAPFSIDKNDYFVEVDIQNKKLRIYEGVYAGDQAGHSHDNAFEKGDLIKEIPLYNW